MVVTSSLLRMICGIGVIACCGCASVTTITCNPSGATVTVNGKYLGETPTSAKVSDEFGLSVYTFTAIKDGYRPESKSIREELFEDARAAIPPHIHFELKPLESSEEE